MKLTDPRSRLELIDRRECFRLLAREPVGRLAVVLGGRPFIFPVNYLLDGETIVFLTDAGTKLDALSSSPVAFEVDGIESRTHSGWSVHVSGYAREVTTFSSPELVRRIDALALRPWAPGDKGHCVQIVPESVTGRRIAHPPEEATS
jgi:uncharacterized protein